MLDFEAAQKLLATQGRVLTATEDVDLYSLNNRILATDIVATIDLPPADNSAMDGYAVRTTDLYKTNKLLIQDHVFAGQTAPELKTGHAMRIFTGGLIPKGADTVVMQEYCTLEPDGYVSFNQAVKSGANIRYQGEDMAQGAKVLSKGTRLHSGHIAVLAAQGLAQTSVLRKLKIGILSTGDELIEPGQSLKTASIYNSNMATISSLCLKLGTQQPVCKHVTDSQEATERAITELISVCDLVFTIGGVSVGDKDFIKPAIQNLGGNLDFWKVQMKPGKPVALAQINQSIVLCLPGNPVSSFVVFALLASPLIRNMSGESEPYRPVNRGLLKLDKAINNGKRTDFMRVKVQMQAQGLPQLIPYYLQSSGSTSSLAWADGLAKIPAATKLENGAEVDWYDLAQWTA